MVKNPYYHAPLFSLKSWTIDNIVTKNSRGIVQERTSSFVNLEEIWLGITAQGPVLDIQNHATGRVLYTV